MPKKQVRAPQRDPRDAMAKFDRLLNLMAPKRDVSPDAHKKAVRRGKKKRRTPTSPNVS